MAQALAVVPGVVFLRKALPVSRDPYRRETVALARCFTYGMKRTGSVALL